MASWIRGKCLGKGAFGTVSVALRKLDGQVFAVKSVDLKTGLPGQLEALESEIRILQRVSSPHVVTFLGDDATCEQRNLHMEYLPGGTLADLDADVDEILVRRYTWCLVSALRHVHSNGVVHCDVKGKNVLVGASGCNCKLADFGSAAEFTGEGIPAATPRGSPLWMAPEVIRRECQGPASDVWSLGCTVIEMLTGKPPWEGNAVDALSRIGFSGEVPEFPSRLSELGRDFLEKCLRREPRRRWSCDQLLQHPFLLPCSANKIAESSPRCVLDLVNSAEFEDDDDDDEEEEMRIETENSARGRIGNLANSVGVNWETQGWVVVRELASDAEPAVAVDSCEDVKEGMNSENFEIARVERGFHLRTSSEYSGLVNERVKMEMRNLVGTESAQWRDEGESEWNRRESEAGWSCQCGWENVDKKKRTIIMIKINIYRLYCKLLKSHCLLLEYVNIYLCFGATFVDYFSCNCDKNMLRIFVKLEVFDCN